MKQEEVTIHVIDDSPDMVDVIKELYRVHRIGANIRTFIDTDAFEKAMSDKVHICIIDYFLKGRKTGLELMRKIHDSYPDCLVIMISAQQYMDTVVDFMNEGGYKYVKKLDEDFGDNLVRFTRMAIKDTIKRIEQEYREKQEAESKEALKQVMEEKLKNLTEYGNPNTPGNNDSSMVARSD